VALGEHAHNPAILNHDQRADLVLVHQQRRIQHGRALTDRQDVRPFPLQNLRDVWHELFLPRPQIRERFSDGRRPTTTRGSLGVILYIITPFWASAKLFSFPWREAPPHPRHLPLAKRRGSTILDGGIPDHSRANGSYNSDPRRT